MADIEVKYPLAYALSFHLPDDLVVARVEESLKTHSFSPSVVVVECFTGDTAVVHTGRRSGDLGVLSQVNFHDPERRPGDYDLYARGMWDLRAPLDIQTRRAAMLADDLKVPLVVVRPDEMVLRVAEPFLGLKAVEINLA
ncbi:hypothetical protein A2160_04765 [Candidatus Beckwithbacteria bacterium RBG_13_42_9]|uniref:Uncharacterized protein n=1 Tax=Candidatus Beckwithbacteria bacterium RBG_13_42_9 TaxID=1797457 RepID=A0A1F5E5R2_9BACT|nr:MAG: hypothetical protein A2160_04765 [Candidatus Beckwithbacteria bacterium RBG_13_42_9]